RPRRPGRPRRARDRDGARGRRARSGHGDGQAPLARRRVPALRRTTLLGGRRRRQRPARRTPGSTFAATTLSLSQRHIRTTLRIPVFVALTLFQPIIWLALYGQLFQKAVQIPGFDASDYTAFLAPGVVVMTALFSGIWSGMATVADLDHGIIDRYLT